MGAGSAAYDVYGIGIGIGKEGIGTQALVPVSAVKTGSESKLVLELVLAEALG